MLLVALVVRGRAVVEGSQSRPVQVAASKGPKEVAVVEGEI
jgi:hypothetical protein